MIPVLILAAGQSSRMRGHDKLLEDVGGEPLLARQIRLATSLGGPVFVAVAPEQAQRRDIVAKAGARVLEVPDADEGMSGSMRNAVSQLPECDAFMLLLGDLVALEAHDLCHVYEAYTNNPEYLIWRGATSAGKPGHPVIFSAQLRPRFEMLSGDSGGEELVSPLKEQTLLVRLEDDRARLDLDTPEDWAAWRETNR
ncbi:nucleotidyltransferase family protein [Yoonia litorea]|uniref:CTP:molybdopterin cytidylyltransferase MocA n=1 Tax=Yoonia litorea TaxID=1123755 RepID=A0A1I6M4U4_9RHOB|nr:nucleotidyltransferase family protein [Yoonia litorea]SFS10735.1 CTP:molybdopterin cytidylyltransferase MocA [Yoonia litorea]